MAPNRPRNTPCTGSYVPPPGPAPCNGIMQPQAGRQLSELAEGLVDLFFNDPGLF